MNADIVYGLIGVKYIYQFDDGRTVCYDDRGNGRITSTKSTAPPDGYTEMPIEEFFIQLALGIMDIPDTWKARGTNPNLVRVFVRA